MFLEKLKFYEESETILTNPIVVQDPLSRKTILLIVPYIRLIDALPHKHIVGTISIPPCYKTNYNSQITCSRISLNNFYLKLFNRNTENNLIFNSYKT